MNTALLNDMILEVQYVNVLINITCPWQHATVFQTENQVMKDMLNMMRHAAGNRLNPQPGNL